MGKSSDAEVQVTEYYLSLHIGVCAEADAITEIVIGEKTAWVGDVTQEQSININRPQLFGGIKKEGGTTGHAYALFGGPLQTLPSALAARFGLTQQNCPGFRGLTSLFFVGSFIQSGWVPVPGSGGGSGGGGGSDTGWTPPGGGACPAPWTEILLANEQRDGPGGNIPAGDLRPGMWVWTRHELTMDWGAFQVEAVTIEQDQPRWLFHAGDRELCATPNHRLYVGGGRWLEINRFVDEMVWGDIRRPFASVEQKDRGDVVRISIRDARTYVSEGLLSHNLKPLEDLDNF